jgi:hypothetical protein
MTNENELGPPARLQQAPESEALDKAATDYVNEEILKLCAELRAAPTRQAKSRVLLSALRRIKNLPPADRAAERDQFGLAIRVIALFVKLCGDEEVGAWLDGLASDIGNLGYGAPSRLFGRNPDFANRADPSQIWRRRAYVAVGVDMLMAAGVARNEITETLNEAKFKKEFPGLQELVRARPGLDDKEKTLRSGTLGKSALWWRDELKKERCLNHEAKAIWDALHEIIKRDQPISDATSAWKRAGVQFRQAEQSV